MMIAVDLNILNSKVQTQKEWLVIKYTSEPIMSLGLSVHEFRLPMQLNSSTIKLDINLKCALTVWGL